MTSAAARVRAAVASLGYTRVRVVGHDIGLMVAYAYAAMYRPEVEKLVLMDAFLPGVTGWEQIYNNPGIWHFRFHGATPEALVAGRERIFLDHLWNGFAADGPASPRMAATRSRKTTGSTTRRPMRAPAGWLRASSISSRFRRPQRTSRILPR